MTNVQVLEKKLTEGPAEQNIITLKKGADEVEIIRLVPKNEMFHAGLEKDYKKLVDLNMTALSLKYLIQNYIDLGAADTRFALTEGVWDSIIGLYAPFIDKERGYRFVKDFIIGEAW